MSSHAHLRRYIYVNLCQDQLVLLILASPVASVILAGWSIWHLQQHILVAQSQHLSITANTPCSKRAWPSLLFNLQIQAYVSTAYPTIPWDLGFYSESLCCSQSWQAQWPHLPLCQLPQQPSLAQHLQQDSCCTGWHTAPYNHLCYWVSRAKHAVTTL